MWMFSISKCRDGQPALYPRDIVQAPGLAFNFLKKAIKIPTVHMWDNMQDLQAHDTIIRPTCRKVCLRVLCRPALASACCR